MCAYTTWWLSKRQQGRNGGTNQDWCIVAVTSENADDEVAVASLESVRVCMQNSPVGPATENIYTCSLVPSE